MYNVKYSVVIPVYNGEKTLEELACRISAVFERLGESFEIVFVDDCSRDQTWSVLEGLTLKNSNMVSIKLAENFGQHNATLCGLFYSRGRYAVTMDDDLQHAPEDIPKLIERMEETGAKAVIARLTDKKHEWYRRVASNLFGYLACITMNKPAGVHLSSFRLVDRQVIDDILSLDCAFPYIPQMIFRVTRDVANADIVHNRRRYGTSNYTLGRMIMLAVRLLLNRFPVFLRVFNKPFYVIEQTHNLNNEKGPPFGEPFVW